MEKASQWPKNFVLDEKKKSYAIQNGIDPARLKDFWDDFYDWCLAKGATYKDWDAAFRMRVRKAKSWGLFQGTAKKPKSTCSSNDKMRKAFDALVYGGHIDAIAARMNLSDYEKECVLMAYSGGPAKVKKLSGDMLRGV
jgi:hypothetical protein